MREPPADLSTETLRVALREQYGLTVVDLTFLPLGHDSSAWVYRVGTLDGASYFLKFRRALTNVPSLLVPHYLSSEGVTGVIAPLATTTGTMWAEIDEGALILYPFVTGATGMDVGLTPSQWNAYGRILQQIHATSPPLDLAELMHRETFMPAGADTIRKLKAHIAGRTSTDPIARRFVAFWQGRGEEIDMLVERAEHLGKQVALREPPSVLCHADIHTANVLVDGAGVVWIVDWDETMLAPRERDLMFVMGGGISRELVGLHDEERFLEGYGAASVDPLALSYYRYAWAVSDIGAYGAEVFFRPDLGEITREAAVDTFMSLFAPGEIVALALASPLA